MTTHIFRDAETGTHALTDAQVRALNVLAEWGSARVSNRTETATGVISAHTARTLHAETLVTPPNRYADTGDVMAEHHHHEFFVHDEVHVHHEHRLAYCSSCREWLDTAEIIDGRCEACIHEETL